MIGRALMVGLPGPSLDPDTASRLRALEPGGVILFRRNLDTPRRLSELLDAVAATVRRPVLVAIDQEGGRVSRLEPWLGATPAAWELRRLGPAAARRWGELTGAVLRALGFNLDFAPVVDVCGPGARNGIGDRAWSDDPGGVIEMAGAFLDGLQAAGVASCLKHFPGLGCTVVDSHLVLPTVERSAEELERIDLRPYRELGPKAAAVMVGHAHYPAWDAGEALPATGSAAIVQGLLRQRLGFTGLVVSDDLEMGAVRALDEGGAFAVRALSAGCDLLLYCSELGRAAGAARALAAAAERNERCARRLSEAGAAIEKLCARWPAGPLRAEAWDAARRELGRFRALEFPS